MTPHHLEGTGADGRAVESGLAAPASSPDAGIVPSSDEERLRASEAGMAEAQRIAHFGSWELDLSRRDVNSNPLRWSDEMYRIAGFEPGSVEVTNELFFRLVPTEEHAAIREAVARAIESRGSYALAHRMTRPDGTERVIHESARIFTDSATGEPVRMVGTAYDVTELKRAEDERRHTSETMLKIARGVSEAGGDRPLEALLESLVDALEADGGIVGRIDPSRPDRVEALSMIMDGCKYENVAYDLAGTPCAQVVRDRFCLHESGVSRSFPDDIMLTERRVEGYAGIELRDRDDHVLGLLAVLYHRPVKLPDLVRSALQIFAARAAAEIERQGSDTRIREQAALLDQARDAIFVRDLDFRVLYWNRGAERLYGWTAEEALGRRVDELIATDLIAFHASNSVLMERGELNAELSHRTKDGRALVIDGRATVLRDSAGKPRRVLAILTDITERKLYENQALRAQRLDSVGTLAAGVAHDLNNALAPILMSGELLRQSLSGSAELELIDTIESGARRAADMVRQVLSFARGIEGERRPVDVAQVVESAAKIARETFPKNIVVMTDVEPDVARTFGDSTQLHQVLVNLCINARDAMPGGGRLRIAAQSDNPDDKGMGGQEVKSTPSITITVEDSGAGMAPALMERIFDPFFTTKEVGKGTGLGLSTSLAIVRGHGGTIAVESEVGGGTRFRIRLPAYSGPTRSSSGTVPSLPISGAGTILVIDDESQIRKIVRTALERRGYTVLLAADGHEGVALFREHRERISVVIVDMMMPVADGPATIRALLAIAPGTRIIAASGVADSASAAKVMALGAHQFLAKPFRLEELLRAVDAAQSADKSAQSFAGPGFSSG
ncbi:MAG: PAS domain S-box protein [Thermoanaerobaculia bacterium]